MVLWHTIIEPKLIEKACLIADLPTHHRRTLLIFFDQQESSFRDPLNSFFDSIGQTRRSEDAQTTSGFAPNIRHLRARPTCRKGPNAEIAIRSTPPSHPLQSAMPNFLQAV